MGFLAEGKVARSTQIVTAQLKKDLLTIFHKYSEINFIHMPNSNACYEATY